MPCAIFSIGFDRQLVWYMFKKRSTSRYDGDNPQWGGLLVDSCGDGQSASCPIVARAGPLGVFKVARAWHKTRLWLFAARLRCYASISSFLVSARCGGCTYIADASTSADSPFGFDGADGWPTLYWCFCYDSYVWFVAVRSHKRVFGEISRRRGLSIWSLTGFSGCGSGRHGLGVGLVVFLRHTRFCRQVARMTKEL